MEQGEKFVDVRVVTTAGVYPESGLERVSENQPVKIILKKADETLYITNTAGWIGVVGGRKIDIERSYRDNGLSGRVEIDWGPDHGAGGHA
jgi:hypothetical protein